MVSHHRLAARGRHHETTGISEGPHRVPKGLGYGYAIHAVNQGVPLHMLSKWIGHAIMETTAIYANAVGQEQRAIAARMWS